MTHDKSEATDGEPRAVQDLQKQLAYANEAKRIESVRLNDTKRELEAVQKRHALAISDLNVKLQLSGEHHDGSGGAEHQLLERLRSVEVERNVLKSDFESMKVNLQGQLESEQQQHAVNLQRMREAESQLAKMEERLSKERELRKQGEEILQETQGLLTAVRSNQAARDQMAPGWLRFLRCPHRSDPAPAPPPQQSAGVSSQGTLWQILTSMRGVTALLCADDTLNIIDASKKAFAVWGSSNLRGYTLLSLVYDESVALWLKQEILCPLGMGGAEVRNQSTYWQRELGSLEFRDKSGGPFDTSVICIRMPAEPMHSRSSAVLIILEPLVQPEAPQVQRHIPNHQVPRAASIIRRPGLRSAVSSVASEDISPFDSASNVNGG